MLTCCRPRPAPTITYIPFPPPLAKPTLRPTQSPCWTLPAEGFQALLDLENSVAPGLPLLARDMANDQKNTISVQQYAPGNTRSLADEISARLCDEAKKPNRRQRENLVVVVPHVAGIVFASLDPAKASTAVAQHHDRRAGGGSGSNASFRATTVLARLELEPAQGRKAGSITAAATQQHQQQQRFVLEDLDMFCEDDSGEGGRTMGGKSGKKRRSARKRQTITMPVTYAALLGEATSPLPGSGEVAELL